MLPLPCCTDPDQVPATAAGSVTDGDGDAVGDGGADGERVCEAAGWLAESGLTACPRFELASCRTRTATAIASTQTVAAAAVPTTLDRRRRPAAGGRATPAAGSGGAPPTAPCARPAPSAP